MKVNFFLSLGLLLSLKMQSQNICIEYNKSQIGKSLRVGYELRLIPNFYLETGIKYIIWTGVSDNGGYVFKDRFRPINFTEHLGIYSSLKYRFYKNEFMQLLVIYNGAISNSHLIFDGYLHSGRFAYDSTTGQLYDLVSRVFEVMPKTFAFENYFGGEASFKLSKKISGFAKMGLGYTFYHIQDDPGFITPIPNTGEHSWFMGGLGLKYSINRQKE